MPRAEISIELDNPRDYFEILEGDSFRHSKVSMKAQGNKLKVSIISQDQKALIAALGGTIKKIRIIEQTAQLAEK